MDTSHELVPTRLFSTAVRRHYVMISIMALIFALAGMAATARMGATYTSTAAVLIKPVPGNPLSPSVTTSNGQQLTVAMATEVGLVTTPAVNALATKLLGRPLLAPHESVKAATPPNSQIVQISYSATNATTARDGANAYAKSFLVYRGELAKQTQDQVLGGLRSQLAVADANLKKASAAAASQTDPRSYAAQQVQLYADRIATLNDNISSAQSVSQVPGFVVTTAPLPASPAGVSHRLVTSAIILVGLMLGLVLAVLREWRDDRFHGRTDTDVAGLPVLAVFPRESTRAGRLVSQRSEDDVVSEAYRRLRSAIVASRHSPRSISFVAMSPGQSTGLVVTNLGLSLTHAGFGVHIVSADLSGREIEGLLGLSNGPGLSELSDPTMDPSAYLQKARRLSVLTAGYDVTASQEMLGGPGFRNVMTALAHRGSFVLLSSGGSWTAAADAASSLAQAVVLVVTEGRTTHALVASAHERFSRLGVEVCGVVAMPAVSRRPTLGRRHADADSTVSSKGPTPIDATGPYVSAQVDVTEGSGV